MLNKGRTLTEKLTLEEMQALVTLNEVFISAFTKIILIFNKSKKVDNTTPVTFPLNENPDEYFMEVSVVQNKETENQAIKIALVKMGEKPH